VTDQQILDVLYVAGPQWGDRSPEDIVAALDAAGFMIVAKPKPDPASDLRTDARKRWLESLMSRLRSCGVGKTYPLDPVERDLVLEESDRLTRLAPRQLTVTGAPFTCSAPAHRESPSA